MAKSAQPRPRPTWTAVGPKPALNNTIQGPLTALTHVRMAISPAPGRALASNTAPALRVCSACEGESRTKASGGGGSNRIDAWRVWKAHGTKCGVLSHMKDIEAYPRSVRIGPCHLEALSARNMRRKKQGPRILWSGALLLCSSTFWCGHCQPW